MSELDDLVKRIEAGNSTIRDGWRLLEFMQAEADRLSELMDELAEKPWDSRVIVRVDNNEKLFRFSSIDALADWLAKGWEK